jgi:type I restriction enzyme S subunit
MKAPLVALGEVVEINMGQAPKGESYNDKGVGYPLIAGASDFGEISPLTSRHTAEPTKISRPGDIILCIRATIGDLNFSNGEYCLGRGVAGLRPKDGVVDTRYLWHSLEASADRLRSKGRGATFLQVSKTDIAALEIPLPPLAEQKRIAAILDQADALRRLRTRALDRLNTLGQAIFQEMFGDGLADRSAWATAILDKIVLENDRINYGVVQPGDHDPLGVPIIRVADLASQAFNLGAVKRISREVDHSYRRSRLKGGEILIGCVGSIGTTLIAPPELKDANIARAVARVPVDPAICDPSFLNAYLRTQEVQNYFLKEVRLVAQPTLNIKQIKETPVFLPPREMQDEFSVRLKGVGALLMQAEHSGVGADFLFASLQHRAFRGEL